MLHDIAGGDRLAIADMRHTVTAFAGAWPYLQLIGGVTGRDPLDGDVVEAYWLGNGLLSAIDTLTWGNSVDDRFRGRAGSDWAMISRGIEAGGVPNHSFHVYCVYPWVGLLRSGMVDHALGVLDKCRIRWGVVDSVVDAHVVVRSRPLVWTGRTLALGPDRLETVDQSIDPTATVGPHDIVAMHWNYVCQKITSDQLHFLDANHRRHIAIVNAQTRRLAEVVES